MNAGFGWSVALSDDGSVALFGASEETKAYIFAKNGSGTWSRQATLTRPGQAKFTFFGKAVALDSDGSVALVGDNYAKVDGNNQEGKVFVFAKDGSGTWNFKTVLTATTGDRLDHFGDSVELSADGSVALIGASDDEYDGNNYQGSAYVFSKNAAGSWTQQDQLVASDGAASDYFGSAVALSDNGRTALVGASGHNVDGVIAQGSAYVFSYNETDAWTERDILTASDGKQEDSFGTSVALSADGATALIGAVGDNVGNGPQGAPTSSPAMERTPGLSRTNSSPPTENRTTTSASTSLSTPTAQQHSLGPERTTSPAPLVRGVPTPLPGMGRVPGPSKANSPRSMEKKTTNSAALPSATTGRRHSSGLMRTTSIATKTREAATSSTGPQRMRVSKTPSPPADLLTSVRPARRFPSPA